MPPVLTVRESYLRIKHQRRSAGQSCWQLFNDDKLLLGKIGSAADKTLPLVTCGSLCAFCCGIGPVELALGAKLRKERPRVGSPHFLKVTDCRFMRDTERWLHGQPAQALTIFGYRSGLPRNTLQLSERSDVALSALQARAARSL